MDHSKLFALSGGRTKTSTGKYSKTSGDVYVYLQFADLMESLLLAEKDADEILQLFKSLSKDEIALPSSYKAIKRTLIPALEHM